MRSTTETPKRYRYTGKERDEESGLYYHVARYYAPWLGRWLSCDPADVTAGIDLYTYTVNNPLRLVDPSGLQEREPLTPPQPQQPLITEEDLAEGQRAFMGGVMAGLFEGATQNMTRQLLPPGSGWLLDGVAHDLQDQLIDLSAFDTGDRGTGSWNPLSTAVAEGDLSDQWAGRGLDLLRAGERAQARAAFGNAGYRWTRMAKASVATGEFVAGVATALVALGSVLANARTYITYVFRNLSGEVEYVGRASGYGDPWAVLRGRIMKGHDVAELNPHLQPEIIAEQGSRAANKGAEGVWFEYYRDIAQRKGFKMLNDPKSPPLSDLVSKIFGSRSKITAYYEDLFLAFTNK